MPTAPRASSGRTFPPLPPPSSASQPLLLFTSDLHLSLPHSSNPSISGSFSGWRGAAVAAAVWPTCPQPGFWAPTHTSTQDKRRTDRWEKRGGKKGEIKMRDKRHVKKKTGMRERERERMSTGASVPSPQRVALRP